MHTLENDQLCVTISDHGAELSGIFDKKNDREIALDSVECRSVTLETPCSGSFSECRKIL